MTARDRTTAPRADRREEPGLTAAFLRAALVLSVFVFAGCSILPFRHRPAPPGRTTIKTAVMLPAQVIGNFIIIEAKWDKHGPYHFVIDTGSANTLVAPALVRRYASGYSPADAPRVRVASAEGDVTELPAATLRRIELGAARFEDVPVLVYDCAGLSAHLGLRIDGILGFPLFAHTQVTLDYPRDRVVIEPPNSLHPAAGTPVRFDDANHTPVIHVQLGDRTLIVLVDSGSDSTFSVNPVGLDEHFLSGPRPGATVGTIGGDHLQQIGRLGDDLAIAGYTVPRPIVDLTDELSAIGGGILKYFTVTFDPTHDRVTFFRDSHGPILIPTRRSAGLSFSKTPAYWRVAGVIPQSPAETAGIQFGDLVTRINGEPVSKWNLTRYEQLVATANEVTVTLLFGTHEVEKRVQVFDLVP